MVRRIRLDAGLKVSLFPEQLTTHVRRSLTDQSYRGPVSSTVTWVNDLDLTSIAYRMDRYLAEHPTVEQVVYRSHHPADITKVCSKDPKVYFMYPGPG